MKQKNLFAPFLEKRDERSPTRFGRLMVVVSVVLAALFLYFALRDLDWQVFFITLKSARYIYLPILILWSSTSFLIRALRLRILLNSARPLPVSNVFWANMAGYLGNNILPARAGELVRAAYLARQNNIGISFALAVGLVERLMDLVALIVLGSFALSFAGIASSPVFQSALKVISTLGLIGLVIIFALPRFEQLITRIIMSFSMLKETTRIKLGHFLGQFLGGLRSLDSFTRALQFTALTVLAWLIDATGAMLLAYMLKIPLLLQQAFILLSALGLSSAIPSTPGYVGVYQFVAVITLAPFGISKADAVAYILMSQIFGYLIVGFWGLFSLWQFNKHTSS